MNVLIVIGRVRARNGQEDALIELMRGMQDASRRERGCLAYGFFEAIEDARELVAVELWASRAALDEHFSTPHLADFTRRLGPLVDRQPTVEIHEVRSTSQLPRSVTDLASGD